MDGRFAPSRALFNAGSRIEISMRDDADHDQQLNERNLAFSAPYVMGRDSSEKV